MTTRTIHVDGLADALGIGFNVYSWFDDNIADLTDEHPSTSPGRPVLVKAGQAYRAVDLPGVTLYLGTTDLSGAAFIESAPRAGWPIRITDISR